MKKEPLNVVRSTAEELLSLVGIVGSVAVSEEEDARSVCIETDSVAMLIGRHGETISSFQYLLGQLLGQKTGEWKRVMVDCGDYRQRQEELMKNLALSTAQRAKETGQPQPIYDLTPGQRRQIHVLLADDPEVQTRSEGEGRDRHLIVESKQ